MEGATIPVGSIPMATSNGTVAESFVARLPELGIPLLLCTDQGTIRAANRAAESILGPVTPGLPISDLPALSGSGLLDAWIPAARMRASWVHEAQARGHDGIERHLRLVALPVEIPRQGRGWAVLLDDLTNISLHARQMEKYAHELRELFAAKQRDLERLQEAQRSRDEFYSIISHELKTPVTALKAAVEMLAYQMEHDPGGRAARLLAASLGRSARRVERLIGDLVDVALARSGALSLNFARIDLVEVLRNVRDDMTPIAARKGVAIHGPGRGTAIVVRGDGMRLNQIVQNLVSNAIKATKAGATVRLAVKRQASVAQVVVVNPGTIDPELRDKLFQPFVKSSNNGYEAGSGLGLAIVRNLAEAHGGGVALESERGRVRFTFTVPLADDPHQDPASA